jgi:hypothetical protein
MADWPTIASSATAGGTLMLAVATFSSVRAGQRKPPARRALLHRVSCTGLKTSYSQMIRVMRNAKKQPVPSWMSR